MSPQITRNGITHAEMVTRLVKSPDQLAQEITDHELSILHPGIGICGEAGEIIDAIKKHVIYRQPLDVENLIEELGDLEFYMEDLRQRIGVTREQTIESNMAKLAKRYGDDYSYGDHKAKARADKARYQEGQE